MKKSVRPLKQPIVATEQELMKQKRQSKRIKTGTVAQTAENQESRCSRIEKSAVDEAVGITLTNDEEVALIKQNRHYMKDESISGLVIEERKVDDIKKDVLVFLVENGKTAQKIPKNVWFETSSGKRMEIATAVKQTGKIIPLQAESGDAVAAIDPPNVLGPTTIGAIVPFPDKDSPVRLLTSAHLIDFDEQHIGRMLHYLKHEDYDEHQPRSSFQNPELELFPVTGFYSVVKHNRPLGENELKNTQGNKMDVLWADVSFEVSENKITSRIAGRHLEGIRAPRRGEYFNLYGLSSGMHRAKVSSTNGDLCVPHRDAEEDPPKYYTYWEGLVTFTDKKKPICRGDSGSALVSDDGYLIGLLCFGNMFKKGYAYDGFACRLQEA